MALGFKDPPSHDVQLNPYLQHNRDGPHPIPFNIALGSNRVTYNTHPSATIPFDPSYLAQPATFPPVARVRIESVADDILPPPSLVDRVHERDFRNDCLFDLASTSSSGARRSSSRATNGHAQDLVMEKATCSCVDLAGKDHVLAQAPVVQNHVSTRRISGNM